MYYLLLAILDQHITSNSIYRGDHSQQLRTAITEIKSHDSVAAPWPPETPAHVFENITKLQLATLQRSFSTTVLTKLLIYQHRPELTKNPKLPDTNERGY